MYFKKKKITYKKLHLNYVYLYKTLLNNITTNNSNIIVYNNKFYNNLLSNNTKFLIKKNKLKTDIYSYLGIIDFFYSFFKKNFYFFFQKNFIDYKFYNFFYKMMVFQKKYKIFGKFSSIFFLYFSLFLYNKKPSLFMDGISQFYHKFTRNEQIGMHNILSKIQKNLPLTLLTQNNIIGMQIKLKGQFCRRAGERRQTKYYKFYKFSTSNPNSKYIIAHTQLNNWSGAVGWTIILLYK